MTFGEYLRELRKSRGYHRRSKFWEHCYAVADACGRSCRGMTLEAIKAVESDEYIFGNEVLEIVALALRLSDAEHEEVLELAKLARRSAADRQETIKKLLARAADMIAGEPDGKRRGNPLRPVLAGEVERMTRSVTPAKVDLRTFKGPRIELGFNTQSDDFVDLELTNVGEGEAKDVVLLMPGPTFKRAARTLLPKAAIEVAVCVAAPDAAHGALIQYADDADNVYLQCLTVPELREPIARRCIERLKTWYDVNDFVGSRLLGATFRYDVSSRDIPAQIFTDARARLVLNALDVSAAYREHKFTMERMPDSMEEKGLPESVAMSEELNAALWYSTVDASEDRTAFDSLEARLRNDGRLFTDVLKLKYASLGDSQRFFNEDKVCLGTDLLAVSDPVTVFRGTYYHGYLTNELATQRVDSRDARPLNRYSGCSQPVFVQCGVRYELSAIAASTMSNHIGASVLLFTSDRRIQYWRHIHGEHNIGKASATGSGSCDWSDWAELSSDRRSLSAMVLRAMERELREESGLLGKAVRDEPIEIRLLGYFRWTRRGGKPEFVGLAKAAIHSEQLHPDVTEVDAPHDEAYFLEADDLDVLRTEIDRFLAQPDRCSLPLWVALTCLRARCEKTPSELAAFLWP